MLTGSCGHGDNRARGASIVLTRVHYADPGGPEKMDYIEGRADGSSPGQQIVIYAHAGPWWVQPWPTYLGS